MEYLELSKKYIANYYNGDKSTAIKEKDGILFNSEKVNKTFSDGWQGFFRYMAENTRYCYFVKL